MTRRSLISFILILCAAVAMAAGKRKFTLVIDPGHGGHDVGAMGKFSKEKDINLRTALAFGKYVERNCNDVKVIYTRKTDVFVTLHGRAEIANKAKADLFISIHTNSLPGKKISRGLETYTLGMHRAADNLDVAKRENSVILVEKDYKKHYEGFDPNSSESYIIFEFLQDHNMAKSVELAKLVQSNVCATANRPNKGVKQAGFLVLRETSMPSCLIELGFISTSDEERFLNNETHVDEMARGIYQAFVKYKNHYGSGSSSSTKAPSQAEEPWQQEPELEIREVVNMKPQPAPSELEIGQLQAAVPTINEPLRPSPRPNQGQVQNQVQRQNQNQPLRPSQSQAQSQNPQVRKEPELPKAQTLPQQIQPKPVEQPKAQTLPQQLQPKPAQQPQVKPLPQEQPQATVQKPKVEPTPAPKAEPKPIAKAEPVQQVPATKPRTATKPITNNAPVGAPVFKIQIFISEKILDPSDSRLKGEEPNYYKEGRVYKYTLGASTDYEEIVQLRKDIAGKFPGCFIVAFKNGEKVPNINDAIIEYKVNKRR
ncbi:MAG: N-acetylmuramoyl-L-alanine amidase [Prevotella sp.]|nr:N-acetylmuramoyl-L-alanine amidase [Prevotella sp.]